MIRQAQIKDLDRCFEIESIAYAGDESASKEKIAKRINTYPQGFIVKELDNQVVGFVNSGACHRVELSDEDFKELIGHDEKGKHIVIMSVVVHPDFQKKGFARELMQAFIQQMKSLNKQDIYLICQTELIDMYAQFGFDYLQVSDSEHGGLAWHEMACNLI
ncbi:MAG: GNAT family N-acetyltransferase [Proteobacteria bacterium]|nr:GNAT family N-acetyltransferase [Pseudomonadota bacterium]